VRPHVKYVGDDACGSCHVHSAIAKTFRRHPMGRSLAPIAAVSVKERLDAASGNPFTHSGLQYLVERRRERIVHRETLANSKRNVLAQIEQEVAYVLGSGTRGRAYLINRDGYLFQSPISWYTQKNAWDLSP